MTLFSIRDDDGSDDSTGDLRPPLRTAGRRQRVASILLTVAFVLLLIMGASPAPYVIELPGPVFNTLGLNHAVGEKPTSADQKKPLISIPDAKTYPTKGALDLLTVSQRGTLEDRPNWYQVLSAWFSPSQAVIPIDVAYPQGLTTDQENAQNQQLMTDSQKDAVAAALNELGYSFPQRVLVKQVIKGTPASGKLKDDDQILSVNGTAVHSVQALRDAVDANGTGKPAALQVKRAGATVAVSLTPTSSQGQTYLGVGAGMDYTFPITVTIRLNDVGGPSAGQMFALGIVDKLSSGPLNGGARVAGTGTIDNAGNVGAIGGIRQKMYGAKDAGATVFLAPKSNCNEVTGHIPDGLHVYSVSNLDDSLKVMDALREGSSTARLPTCSVG